MTRPQFNEIIQNKANSEGILHLILKHDWAQCNNSVVFLAEYRHAGRIEERALHDVLLRNFPNITAGTDKVPKEISDIQNILLTIPF